MKNFTFPIEKKKVDGVTQIFSLDDPKERKEYFDQKAKKEIEKIRAYLKGKTFVAFLIGPKNSGKGTYSKLFAEAVGKEYSRHIAVGDIVRNAYANIKGDDADPNLMSFLESNYRGFMPLDEAIEALIGKSQDKLLPTELILALVEYEISRSEGKALFIDGFPRELTQISYALYFGALMGYRDDPDFFVFIDVPESVIDERIKFRVVCPVCHTPRNTKLLRTNKIEYDKADDLFHLICDDPDCKGARMVSKEGDSLGIEIIRDRIEADKKVAEVLLGLYGVPKIYLRNSIPVSEVSLFVDDYEVTPAYRYELKEGSDEVGVIEEPWTINDENGIESYSLLPSPIVLSLIRQIVKVLNL
jgi:adenylate kinase family enzyme